MKRRTDDDFRPRVGKTRTRDSAHTQSFIARVPQARTKAGPTRVRSARPSFKARNFNRGAIALHFCNESRHPRARRVLVKTRLVNLKRVTAKSVAMHLKYIERDGVTPDGGKGHAYGRDVDHADTRQFAERCRDDRHQFRFIVSPEDAMQLGDLREFTRTLMQQMEKDFETRLEWVAVDHWDTANPHTHVVLRGKDQHRRDLVIAREYISDGMRLRASELATEWLGLRTERELRESLTRDVDQERWTPIDRALMRQADDGVIDLRHRATDERLAFDRSLKLRRLHRLSMLGLARENAPGVWTISTDAEKVLRTLGERGDIIRTMQRAFSRTHRDFSIVDPTTLKTPITGRLTALGVADE